MSGRLLPTSLKRTTRKPKRFEVSSDDDEDASPSPPPPKKKKVSGNGTTVYPTVVPQATIGRPSILSQYDSDMLSLAKLRTSPKKIARLLRELHGLSEDVCGTKNVENRLRYIKLHGLGQLPPTNTDIDLRAG